MIVFYQVQQGLACVIRGVVVDYVQFVVVVLLGQDRVQVLDVTVVGCVVVCWHHNAERFLWIL